MKPITMLDLKAEFFQFEDAARAVVDDVFAAQAFIGGRQVGELEEKIAAMLGCRHAIAVSSGTDAILLSLMAAGIGPGDEVITTPFTFFATAGCIHRTGAKPIFIDILPDTFNIDPRLIEAAITPRTKAILPVHLFGQCADMDPILKIAADHGMFVIEDAAQAIGAKYRDKSAGTFGLAGCFSFYPTKNLGGYGEGGMVVSNDDDFAVRARQMRNHGQTGQYQHELIGGNFRLDTMKAGFLLAKTGKLDAFNEARRTHAASYEQLLADIPEVRTPVVRSKCHMVYHQYTVLCQRRDALRAALGEAKIGCGVYYPMPLHLQPCFAALGGKAGDCPVSESSAQQVLSLPVHPMLEQQDVDRVAEAVRAFYSAVPA